MPITKMPDTSRDAYRSLKHSELQALYEKILWGLGQIKEGTFEEIGEAIKEPRDRVWRRMGELMKAGKVYRPGTKKPLKSGREGYTWRLLGDEPTAPVTERVMKGPTVSDYSKKILQQQLF
jgi:predicted transcriptional regulator